MMTKQYNSAIFDWSNVCTMEGQSNPMSAYIARELGLEKEIVKQIFKKVENPYVTGDITGKDFIIKILEELRIKYDKSTIQKLVPALTTAPTINTELLSYISDLKNSVTTILFSDNFLEMSKFVVQKYKLHNIFNHLVFSNHSKFRKPDHRYYKYMIKKTNINPHQSIFVDDREKNLIPARNTGITTILFTSTKDTIKQIDKLLNLNSKGQTF